jgi:hypothetical protein
MKAFFLISTLLTLALPGCFVGVSSDSPPARGSLLIDWTVDGSKDPAECRQGGADSIDVIVTTSDGGWVGEYQDWCDAFATRISLAPGGYSFNAVLVDARGSQLTTGVTEFVRVYAHDTAVSAIDFPADAFL